MQITIQAPMLWCDFCSKAILYGPPDNAHISKVSNTSNFGGCGPEYAMTPNLDTPEWWEEAKREHGWTEFTIHGRSFTACASCSRKASVPANGADPAHSASPEGKG